MIPLKPILVEGHKPLSFGEGSWGEVAPLNHHFLKSFAEMDKCPGTLTLIIDLYIYK